VLDIGLGEGILIAVLALLVFGPERLPKVASDAARALRQVRTMASAARRDLADAAGLEEDGELAQTLRDVRDLDPRRALRGGVGDPRAARGADERQVPAADDHADATGGGPSAAGAAGDGTTRNGDARNAAHGNRAPGHGATDHGAPGSGAAPQAPGALGGADPDWS
jgi:sec-independent protein translocase protein TatB